MSGLGKGLAGILGDALAYDRAPEVSQLLRVSGVRRHPEMRRLVSELALGSMAEGFGAQSAVLVSRDGDGRLSSVAARLAPNWNLLDPVSFETVGRLYQALVEEPGPNTSGNSCRLSSEQFTLEGASILVCRSSSGSVVTATAIVRREAFSDNEEATIGRIVRSVAIALRGETDARLLQRLTVELATPLVSSQDDQSVAHVTLTHDGSSPVREGLAEDPDPVSAVAIAAARACSDSLAVTFVGQIRFQDGPSAHVVTVVVLRDRNGPLFGLSITDPTSQTGPAEAVLNAAGVTGSL
ncbi:MAG: hypothetical protein O3C27_11870 [Actinomycetota bacterium]|nr:hypothetical protein [Actinomycetota bacterium]